MNKFGSIVDYREKVANNILYKALTLLKLNADLKKVLNKVNKSKFDIVKEKYKDIAPAPGYSKYLDIEPWMRKNIWHVFTLGLEREKYKNILDIGTGNAYFPFICKYYGHQVRTIDIWTDPMFNELVEVLEIPRRDYEIKNFEAIEPFDIKFDMITGFMVCFNGHRSEKLWKSAEWEFFMRDLAQNHTNPGAEAYFQLNAELDTLLHYTPELLAWFLKMGAEVDDDRVYFKSLDIFR
jgi:hypothetical protein